MRRDATLALLAIVACAPALAQETGAAPGSTGRVAAVLAVEDGDHPVTERLGVALFGRFLEDGPYARVLPVTGEDDDSARLTAAIREAAAGADAVDVFAAVHTTSRGVDELRAGLPPAVAAKLRLVYSTACYGAEAEREAWKAAGARAVVTHQGLNVPQIALPYVLSRWIGGAPIGPAVAEGYRETQLHLALTADVIGAVSSRYALPLDASLIDWSGCRPVISGDAHLTVTTGAAGLRTRTPARLAYRRDRGGFMGLTLRALEGLELDAADADLLLERSGAGAVVPPAALEHLVSLGVGTNRGEGRVELRMRRAVRLPLPGMPLGIKLRVAREVSVQPGRLDAAGRRVELHARGLSLVKGPFSLRLKRVTLVPGRDGRGVRVRVSAGLFGFIPVWKTITVPRLTSPADEGVVLEPIEAQQTQAQSEGMTKLLEVVTSPTK